MSEIQKLHSKFCNRLTFKYLWPITLNAEIPATTSECRLGNKHMENWNTFLSLSLIHCCVKAMLHVKIANPKYEHMHALWSIKTIYTKHWNKWVNIGHRSLTRVNSQLKTCLIGHCDLVLKKLTLLDQILDVIHWLHVKFKEILPIPFSGIEWFFSFSIYMHFVLIYIYHGSDQIRINSIEIDARIISTQFTSCSTH